MSTACSIIAAVLALMWLPVVRNFYKSWSARKNPVSLAICWMVIVVMYSHLLYALVISFGADQKWVSIIALAFSFIACVNFYVSFYWANRKFKDTRHADEQKPKSSSIPPE